MINECSMKNLPQCLCGSIKLFGDHKAVVRPDPIPNSAVKRSIADGSGSIGSARVGCRQFFQTKRRSVPSLNGVFASEPVLAKTYIFAGADEGGRYKRWDATRFTPVSSVGRRLLFCCTGKRGASRSSPGESALLHF